MTPWMIVFIDSIRGAPNRRRVIDWREDPAPFEDDATLQHAINVVGDFQRLLDVLLYDDRREPFGDDGSQGGVYFAHDVWGARPRLSSSHSSSFGFDIRARFEWRPSAAGHPRAMSRARRVALSTPGIFGTLQAPRAGTPHSSADPEVFFDVVTGQLSSLGHQRQAARDDFVGRRSADVAPRTGWRWAAPDSGRRWN